MSTARNFGGKLAATNAASETRLATRSLFVRATFTLDEQRPLRVVVLIGVDPCLHFAVVAKSGAWVRTDGTRQIQFGKPCTNGLLNEARAPRFYAHVPERTHLGNSERVRDRRCSGGCGGPSLSGDRCSRSCRGTGGGRCSRSCRGTGGGRCSRSCLADLLLQLCYLGLQGSDLVRRVTTRRHAEHSSSAEEQPHNWSSHSGHSVPQGRRASRLGA